MYVSTWDDRASNDLLRCMVLLIWESPSHPLVHMLDYPQVLGCGMLSCSRAPETETSHAEHRSEVIGGNMASQFITQKAVFAAAWANNDTTPISASLCATRFGWDESAGEPAKRPRQGFWRAGVSFDARACPRRRAMRSVDTRASDYA